jgi:hypothetical protein
MRITCDIQTVVAELAFMPKVQFVLFGLRPNLASHFERSSLSRSYGWDSADDRPQEYETRGFASFNLISETFMQYTG